MTIADVSRIVPLWGSISEVIFDLGLGVTTSSPATSPPPSRTPPTSRWSPGPTTSRPSRSCRCGPTVVLADTDSGPPEALEQIRNVGIPVVVFEQAERVDEIAGRIRTIAAALGVRRAGRGAGRRHRRRDRRHQGRAARHRGRAQVAFLYMRGQAGVHLIGGPGSGPTP